MQKIKEPMLNVPPVVTATLVVLALIHAVRALLLTAKADLQVLLLFAFIPARYEATPILYGAFPGGLAADVWTFVTYALLHGDWMHIGLNAFWFLAFGSAVARRFGAIRFIVFFAVTAAAGALAHLVAHAGEPVPMIGASAAISGYMAAAMRFAFQGGGPLEMWRRNDMRAYQVPAVPLIKALSDPRIVLFLVAWFGLNLLFGLGSLALPGGEQEVAWQAHIGGFLAGLLLFALFDPIRPHAGEDPPAAASRLNGSGEDSDRAA